jgi:hypothetical protein
MTSILQSLATGYHYLMTDLRDPRVDSWPLMSSIWPTTTLCLLYVCVVQWAGPAFMRDRQPYNIKPLMLAYNLVQTLLSCWMFLHGWHFYVYPGSYSWHCQPVDYSHNPEATRALLLSYMFYLSKFLDMFDSFFFIARKKFGHLSFLHVSHHGSLPLFCWLATKFVGGGNSGFAAFINTGVHTVMYFYYLLAACGPHMLKYLWWKKYVTLLQIAQFVLVSIHSLQPIFFDCNYPKIFAFMWIITCLLFWIQFSLFYQKTYSRKRNAAKEKMSENIHAVTDEESHSKSGTWTTTRYRRSSRYSVG